MSQPLTRVRCASVAHLRRPLTARVVGRSAASVAVLLSLVVVPLVAGNGAAVARAPLPGLATCPGPTYTVLSGDSWYRIASRVGVSVTALLTVNNATTATVIHPNQVLCLPGSAVTTTTVSPVPPTPGGLFVITQFPVQGLCWFSDSFGAPRPGGRTHEGVDIIAYQGQKVYAVDDGVLTKQYLDAPGLLAGNGWRLTRADGSYFFYAHLSEFAPGLKVGSSVKAGQILGLVGRTGAAGTPHLHFEVHPGGGPAINPTSVVTAVNGCKITRIPPQPGETPPATTAPATSQPPVTSAVGTTTTTPARTPPTTVPPATIPVVPGPGLWQFIAPVVALDTDGPTVAAGAPRAIRVAGLVGVPDSAPGVMVRAVVENASLGGSLTLYACDAATPTATTLNYTAGRMNAAMSIVGTRAGNICAIATTAVDLRVEVVGYLSTVGVGVLPTPSLRAVDTRLSSPLAANGTLALVPSKLGTPRGAKAVTVSVTLLAPAAAGKVSIGPCGGTPWTLSYTSAPTQLFSAVVRTNDAGVCVSTTSTVNVVVDVTGVWHGTLPLGIAGPVRVYDSRSSGLVGTATQQVTLGLPSTAARAELTVAVLAGGGPGALYVWNCATARPAASVAATSGAPMAATVTMDVTGRSLCLASTGSVHAIIDVTGTG